MKNLKKLIAILASASMIMSIGATAFADTYLTEATGDEPILDPEAGTITFVVEGTDLSVSSEEQITLMAYEVPADTTAETIPAYTNQKILALDQAAGADGFGDENGVISFNVDYLTTGKAVIRLGGSDGTVANYLLEEVIEGGETFYKITGFVNDVYATVTVGETTVNVGADGAFTIDGLENGTYSVIVKAPGALNRTLSATIADADAVVSTENDKTTLVYGAISEDATSVGLADLTAIKVNYNKADGQDGYSLNLDFDRSGKVDLADLTTVKVNYNKTIDQLYGN